LTYIADDTTEVIKTIRWRDGAIGTAERMHSGAKGLGSVLLMRRTELARLHTFFSGNIELRGELSLMNSSGIRDRATSARPLPSH
jgi:hypothetical protein